MAPGGNTQRPKRIVVLSDGTGNSSAKLMKTNVWRIYQAIDHSDGDHVALYDNGVGSSSALPLTLLGGAFGWGLKRNVLQLYRFICQHYATGDGSAVDAIYAFGFSRGAFTIRVLIGMIESQGLVHTANASELRRLAKWAYREYRRAYHPAVGLVATLRDARDVLVRWWEHRAPYARQHNVRPRVAFVGLWDTVAAYGLPMDEVTRGWDRYVWPLSLHTHECPTIVEKACHALALDDARATFHPVLFDEVTEPLPASIDDERVTQVWFAGAHSNVGGGYPDDTLSYVPLKWMADQACASARYLPLRLRSTVRDGWEATADCNGPLYDSRRGLGAYYRYGPRILCNRADDGKPLTWAVPKIHESVLQRIVAGTDHYAPHIIPERFAVVSAAGLIASANGHFEHTAQRQSRVLCQRRASRVLRWRRVTHFVTVAVTIALLVAPLLPHSDGVAEWASYYRQQPLPLVVGVAAMFVMRWCSSQMQHAGDEQMRDAWQGLRPVAPSDPP